jgi:hypothetical protein
MTQMRQKSASRAPINEAEPSHPAPKLLLPFRQHPNPLISKQIKMNQRNSRIFKAKNNGVSYDHRLLLPISLNRNLPIGFVHAILALPFVSGGMKAAESWRFEIPFSSAAFSSST